MNILEALDDKNLFAPHFRGPSWTSWRAFLAALFALAMGTDQRRHLSRGHRPLEQPCDTL